MIKMKRDAIHPLMQVALFAAGILVTALGFNMLLLPNDIVVGGLPGLSLLLKIQWGIEPAVSQWVVGVPIFLFGWLMLGKKAIINSLAGAIFLPLTIYLTRDVYPLRVETPMLAALFGGFTCGIGLGMVFRANSTVGGFSILARIVGQRMGVPLSKTMLLLDGAVVVTTGVFLGVETAMLALVGVVSLSKAIDVVHSGLGSAKSVTIITDAKEDMRVMLLDRLNCGATVLRAEGAYSQDERALLVTVIPRAKVARLRRNIRRVDPSAFTIISDASEVLGYGFQNHG
ncbi:MAG: YitT family protein [Akkermansiaceae bacterium]